jgi:hypothetical protein
VDQEVAGSIPVTRPSIFKALNYFRVPEIIFG